MFHYKVEKMSSRDNKGKNSVEDNAIGIKIVYNADITQPKSSTGTKSTLLWDKNVAKHLINCVSRFTFQSAYRVQSIFPVLLYNWLLRLNFKKYNLFEKKRPLLNFWKTSFRRNSAVGESLNTYILENN